MQAVAARCFILSLAILFIAGCADPAPPKPPAPKADKSADSGENAAAPAANAAPKKSEPNAETAKATPTRAEAVKAMPHGDKPAAAKSDPARSEAARQVEAAPVALPKKTEAELAAVSKADPTWKTSVVLGEDDLTSGIPGNGPLTLEEITAWLAKPGVHETLKVQLPLGLKAGEAKMKGLEANPLTRAKIELGRQLYFDTRLSGDNTVSCASCHHPDEGYGKHTQFGVGMQGKTGARNSPVSYNRILSDVQFWDGRAATLEAQAVGPIANPIEMGNTHEKSIETVKAVKGYQIQSDSVFGKDSLNIENLARAIAAFERALVTRASPFDYFEALKPFAQMSKEDIDELQEDDPETFAKYQRLVAESKQHPINESAIRGRDLFFSERVNCSACHVGANLTDELYHNLGVGMDKQKPDLGRYDVTHQDKDKGAFKTPTIRNVALSAPYMHDGSQKTLEEVVEWYNKGGHPNPHLDAKVKPLKLTDQEKADLVEFMKACTGDLPKVEPRRIPA